MSQKFIWKAKTINKPLDDGELLQLMLQKLFDISFIKQVEWIITDWNDKKYKINSSDPEQVYQEMIAKIPKKDYIFGFDLGGSSPYEWEIGLAFGMGARILFTFSSDLIEEKPKQDLLLEQFKTVHQQDNTEYAFIHPLNHYYDLEDDKYYNPITIQGMFEGVYWANFIGQGHIESFDYHKINAMNAYKTEWLGDNKHLFLQAVADIHQVTSKSSEKELVRLTNLFNKAKVEGSKWYD
ncbi:hypothetical protein [Microscilla marina]|uniref:Uncharacterized protein n=1 Tax=Microscilla marina ATCC 23134 TaxID=313606 RepID=A1ZLU6_MICM2|nr:hypothetical protein [Microscilla marina]EAY28850.1 hypothetical protein M23134_07948 [Microscilla marina ATCC 23134]